MADTAVRVVARVRPLSESEKIGKSGLAPPCVVISDAGGLCIDGKEFVLDAVFGEESTQTEVFDNCAASLVDACFTGINATLLAYGQTGSGKTYTMGSSASESISSDNIGVIPRVMRRIFEKQKECERSAQCTIKCSFLEILNEDIRDLLDRNPTTASGKSIREDGSGGVLVSGLVEEPVHSTQEMALCLARGCRLRATASTSMNETSSRSHAIFCISIEKRILDEETGEDTGSYVCAKLHLVDLAGSERVKKTLAEGQRLKEGISINRGLLALGNVISALADEKKRVGGGGGHIPYRDSKLTRLLQDSLGGNSKTVMIACLSPAECNTEETLNTLKYAARTREIKNRPTVNKGVDAGEIARLRAQVAELQQLTQSNGSCESEVRVARAEAKLHEIEAELRSCRRELVVSAERSVRLFEAAAAIESERDRLLELLRENNITPPAAAEESTSSVVSISSENASSINFVDAVSNEDEKEMSAHTKRQQLLGSELMALGEALRVKEQLVAAMSSANDDYNQLEAGLARLQEEKQELLHRLAEMQQKQQTSSTQISHDNERTTREAEMKARLRQLENEVNDFRQKRAAVERTLKARQSSQQEMTNLRNEISEMKAAKVALVKKMREETDQFRIRAEEKERDCVRMKREQQKQKYEMQKLQSAMEKQSIVLRRKTEEVAATAKRLRNALQTRRSASAASTANGANTAAAAVTTSSNSSAANGPKMGERELIEWISAEADALAGLRDARRMLSEYGLVRHSLIHQQSLLHKRLQKKNLTGSRVEAWGESKDDQDDENEIKREQREIAEQLTTVNEKIRVLEADVAEAASAFELNDGSSRWSELRTLDEIRLALDCAFEQCVSSRLTAMQQKATLSQLQERSTQLDAEANALRSQQRVHQLERDKEMAELAIHHQMQIQALLHAGEDMDIDEFSSSSYNIVQSKLQKQIEKLSRFSQMESQLELANMKLSDTEAELSKLREELSNIQGIREIEPPKAKKAKKEKPVVERRESLYESESDDALADDGSDVSFNSDSDEEWTAEMSARKRHHGRRGRELSLQTSLCEEEKVDLKVTGSKKRRIEDKKEKPIDIMNEIDMIFDRDTSVPLGCSCGQKCMNKRCSCRAAGRECSSLCKCKEAICVNREHAHSHGSAAESPESSLNSSANSTILSNNSTNTSSATIFDEKVEQPTGKASSSSSTTTGTQSKPSKTVSINCGPQNVLASRPESWGKAPKGTPKKVTPNLLAMSAALNPEAKSSSSSSSSALSAVLTLTTSNSQSITTAVTSGSNTGVPKQSLFRTVSKEGPSSTKQENKTPRPATSSSATATVSASATGGNGTTPWDKLTQQRSQSGPTTATATSRPQTKDITRPTSAVPSFASATVSSLKSQSDQGRVPLGTISNPLSKAASATCNPSSTATTTASSSSLAASAPSVGDKDNKTRKLFSAATSSQVSRVVEKENSGNNRL